MISERQAAVMQRLNEKSEDLISHVTQHLITCVPIVGVSPSSEAPELVHHHNLALTARRFHELVQVGVTVDWVLVSADFGWTERKLRPMGITRDHHRALIDAYFAEARTLLPWTPDEHTTLDEIAAHFWQAVEAAYHTPDGAEEAG
jgi:hypothetical protein